MSEIKLTPQASVQPIRADDVVPALPGAGDIRLLDELELALAGGGDLPVDWP
jgi:hypothetical protein